MLIKLCLCLLVCLVLNVVGVVVVGLLCVGCIVLVFVFVVCEIVVGVINNSCVWLVCCVVCVLMF